MKRKPLNQFLSMLLAMVMLVGLLPTAAIPVFAVEESDIYAEDPNYEHGYFLGGRGYWEGGTWVREVYDWDDMDQVFEKLDSSSMFNYGYVTIKLMADLSMTAAGLANDAYTMKEYSVDYGLNNVVFDFNGHTLSATDDVSTTNQEYPLESFIRLYVGGGNIFTFTDSVGGGGINFYSSRAIDSTLAALHVYTVGTRAIYNEEDPNSYPAKVIFNGGTYEMTAKIDKFSSGTCYDEFLFRGTVIADYVDVEINDGTFIANSEGLISSTGFDMCARELAAFGTVISDWQNFPDEANPKYGEVIPYEETGRTVINGGKFISDGYAVHHFENCNLYQFNGLTDSRVQTLDSHFHVNYPTINGGYFEGQMGFTGLTFTYSDGNSALNSRPASEIIPETALFVGVDKDGDECTDITDWDWDDLHDMKSCVVISGEAIKFNTTPEGEGDPIEFTRTVKQSDTFEMSWTVPSYLEGVAVCQPMITVTRPNSNIEPKTYAKSKITLDYSEYPNDVNVSCGLYVFVEGEDALLQQAAYLQKDYTVDVKRVYTVTDNCLHCYVANDGRVWNEIVEGGSCSFKIYPKDYYELTDPDKLEVYVNGDLVTPDEDGVYTVQNVTEDLDIYCDGSGFTSYSNLTVTANGKTVTEKIFDGGTYTFKTLAEFGATVPENSTFTGWKIGNKTYQPGETYTVPGGGEIKINAAFTGLYNITVEGGKAYADEAHTIPISAAAENQVIYVVADPAPEGKVFSYWNRTFAVVGGHGWFGDSEAAVTTFTVYDSDVVLTPVYETQIDNIVINGMTKPSAGVAIDNSDYSYKWGCSVPADAGYTLGICYWYDITDGEPEFAMSDGDVFQIGHTYRFKARIHLKADHIYPANPEDIAVVLSGIDAEDYRCTINEVGYSSATIYFEFTCEREEPDTALIRPKGDGTSGNPFQITNIGELYWFAAFVNGTASYPDGVTVERSEACAIVMNDITVNPELLTEDGELNGTSGFAQWTPIAPANGYEGTFDGQGYAISGIYYNPGIDTAFYSTYYAGFFGCYIDDGGIVRNLTLKDTYIGAPREKSTYDAGGIAGMVSSDGTVENCHFDGTVTADDTNGTYTIGGIAGRNHGVIRNCTTKGLVKGYTKGDIGGIAGKVARYTEDGGYVIGCVNEATVKNTRSDDVLIYTGGIAGELYNGNIRDCCNKGNVSAVNDPAGIVSYVYGDSSVIRCWNEGDVEGEDSAGIVSQLRATVKNCYNTGSVNGAGIVARPYSYCSITYCHNVGDADSIVSFIDSYATIENCYYLADSETDVLDGTTAKTAAQFADGTVLALLDNGHWTQGEDDEYPVLGDAPGVTVSGMVTSFGKESEQTTVQLFPVGSETPAFSVTLTGTHAMYSFEGVEAGTYTMKVSKANHVTREYTVVVGNSPIPLDAKIHLKGDINGDGEITSKDKKLLYNYVNDPTKPTTDYEWKVADIDGNGDITSKDKKLLYNHINDPEKSLWE